MDRFGLPQLTIISARSQILILSDRLLGAIVHAVGGIEDHVHVAASVLPHLALYEFIGQMKGSSSHFANHKLGLAGTFGWQAEYGVVSFHGKQLARIVAYVRDQRGHHAQGTMIPALERSAGDSPT